MILNPFAATATEWRVGCGIGLEAVLYGLPLTLLYPLAEHLKLITHSTDLRMQTWRWTCIQGLTAAAIMLGILAFRSPEGSAFVYFQF